jgi:hypothetical protein
MLTYLARISGLSRLSIDADFETVLLFSLLGLTGTLFFLQTAGADVSVWMINAG